MTISPTSDLVLSTWEPVDLGPILRGEKVTPSPTVFARDDGVRLLYPGRLNLFIGETESCKSWGASMAVAQEMTAGHPVIYVDFEDTPENAIERLRALGVTPEQIGDLFTYFQPSGPFNDLATMMLEDAIREKGLATLAVVDGVTDAMMLEGLEPRDGSDVSEVLRELPPVARTNRGCRRDGRPRHQEH